MSVTAAVPHDGATDLVPLFLDAVEALRPPTPAVVVEHPESCLVRTDPGLLQELLATLVSNAVRHALGRAEIRLVLGIRPGCSFFLRDNGCGFEPSQATALFQHPGDAQCGPHSLARIAARLVAGGGRIWADAEQGWGATFFVILPPA